MGYLYFDSTSFIQFQGLIDTGTITFWALLVNIYSLRLLSFDAIL